MAEKSADRALSGNDLHYALYSLLVSEGVEGIKSSEDINVADALAMIAVALTKLGLNNADSSMGALEAHAKAMLDSSEKIATALEHIAQSIDALDIG